MPYTDLLRVTVFLTGAEATALGAITAIGANRDERHDRRSSSPPAWWLISLGDRLLPRPAGARRRRTSATPLARARTATSLPPETAARIAVGRLWPIAVTAIVAGGLGLFFPGVAVIGAGYALIVSLAWHTREAAVLGDRAARRRQVLRRPHLRPAARSSWSARPGLRSDRLSGSRLLSADFSARRELLELAPSCGCWRRRPWSARRGGRWRRA